MRLPQPDQSHASIRVAVQSDVLAARNSALNIFAAKQKTCRAGSAVGCSSGLLSAQMTGTAVDGAKIKPARPNQPDNKLLQLQ